jgi:hypothetical protein
MKKLFLIITLSMFILIGTSNVGYCMSENSKNSIYLPNNSWVINKLYANLQSTMHANSLHLEWRKKVLINYNCVKTGVPEGEFEFRKILEGDCIGLIIPMKDDDPFMGSVALQAIIRFGNYVENEDLIGIMQATAEPRIAYEIKIMSNIVSNSHQCNMAKMQEKERDQIVVDMGFVFDDNVKLYSVNMGRCSEGYVLKDSQNHLLFWCCRGFWDFSREQFYNFKDVLNSYKEYNKQYCKNIGISWI